MDDGTAGWSIAGWLAVAWLVVILVIDVVTGPAARLGALYAIAALLASVALPPVSTAVVAAVAVGLGVASGWWDHDMTSSSLAGRIPTLVLVSAAAVVASVIRVHGEATHARVTALAETAQRAILPTLPRRVGWVATGTRYEAAGEDALVGGDLYDSYWAPGLTRFMVGDVRGKGVSAVEQAARVIRAFRQAAATGTTLDAVATHMSSYLAGFFDPFAEEFVTALLVEVTDGFSVTAVGCGHPPPMLASPSGQAATVDLPAGLPLGLGVSYTAATFAWAAGDRLLLYTDGLVEARDTHGEFLPMQTLAPHLVSGSVEDALDALLATLCAHVPHGRLLDDLAVVLLENTGVDVGLAPVTVTPELADVTIKIPVVRPAQFAAREQAAAKQIAHAGPDPNPATHLSARASHLDGSTTTTCGRERPHSPLTPRNRTSWPGTMSGAAESSWPSASTATV